MNGPRQIPSCQKRTPPRFPPFFIQILPLSTHSEVILNQSTMGQNRKKNRINNYPSIHCPTSEGVNERTDEKMAQYFSVYSWLFWPTVQSHPQRSSCGIEILQAFNSFLTYFLPILSTASLHFSSKYFRFQHILSLFSNSFSTHSQPISSFGIKIL